MKRTFKDYKSILVTLATAIFIMGVAIFICGLLLRLSPASLSEVLVTKTAQQNSFVCHYKGLQLCQMSDDLSNFEYESWFKRIGEYLLFVGVVIMIHSMAGIAGVYLQSNFLLMMMLFVICQSVANNCIAMDIINNQLHEYHTRPLEAAKESVLSYLPTGRKESSFTLGLNLMMMTLGCCGASNWRDLPLPINVTDDDGTLHQFPYPPACCDFSLRPMASVNHPVTEKDNLEFLMNCHDLKKAHLGLKKDSLAADPPGCYQRLHARVYDRHGTGVLCTVLFLVLYQAVEVIFTLMVYLTLPKGTDPISPGQKGLNQISSAHQMAIPSANNFSDKDNQGQNTVPIKDEPAIIDPARTESTPVM